MIVRTFYRARVAFKRWLARHRLVIEFCKDCGRKQPVIWWAPSDALWFELMGSVGGVACPDCFDKRAWEAGIMLRWTATVEHRS